MMFWLCCLIENGNTLQKHASVISKHSIMLLINFPNFTFSSLANLMQMFELYIDISNFIHFIHFIYFISVISSRKFHFEVILFCNMMNFWKYWIIFEFGFCMDWRIIDTKVCVINSSWRLSFTESFIVGC